MGWCSFDWESEREGGERGREEEREGGGRERLSVRTLCIQPEPKTFYNKMSQVINKVIHLYMSCKTNYCNTVRGTVSQVDKRFSVLKALVQTFFST